MCNIPKVPFTHFYLLILLQLLTNENIHNFNVPLQIIKELLVHANITTTSKYYIHVYDSKEKRVTRTLNFIRLFF